MSDLESALLRRISKLNRLWALIESKDRVMVACSGGKDSWALLHLLAAYQRVVPFSFDIVAMNLDQGHPGFPADVMRGHFEAHGFEHHIEYQDTYSVVTQTIEPGKIYCSLCSRMRRGALHKVARQLGANKIALGHHRDDAIETVLMSMMHSGQIKSMPPMLPANEGGAAVIRPLASCAEQDLAAYAAKVGVPIIPCGLCGSQSDTKRQAVKALLVELEGSNPRVRENLFASLGHVRAESLFDRSLTEGAGASGSAPVDASGRLRVLVES